jgi:hypothetical protein
MMALLVGSVAWGAPLTHQDRVEFRSAAHFLASVLDVREHRLVVLDGIVVIGRDRLDVCHGLVDLEPDRVELLGPRGLIFEHDRVWFGGRRWF